MLLTIWLRTHHIYHCKTYGKGNIILQLLVDIVLLLLNAAVFKFAFPCSWIVCDVTWSSLVTLFLYTNLRKLKVYNDIFLFSLCFLKTLQKGGQLNLLRNRGWFYCIVYKRCGASGACFTQKVPFLVWVLVYYLLSGLGSNTNILPIPRLHWLSICFYHCFWNSLLSLLNVIHVCFANTIILLFLQVFSKACVFIYFDVLRLWCFETCPCF